MNKLSVVILTRNESLGIKDAIKSIKTFADEIIVIDDNSTDRTAEIAKKMGAVLYKNSLTDFSSQRNFGLKKTKGDWILFIDADEVVTAKLAGEIKEAIESPRYNGYYIPRKDYFLSKPLNYGEAGNLKLLRLGRRSSGIWTRRVHETWNVKGEVGILDNYLNHYSHKDITDFVNSINNFSSLHARENLSEGKKSTLFKIVLWPVGKLFYNYFLKLGFLDGTRGFIYAILMSFHSFLAWSKQWTEEHD